MFRRLITIRRIPLCQCLILGPQAARGEELGDEGFAGSDGVKLHDVTAGKRPRWFRYDSAVFV